LEVAFVVTDVAADPLSAAAPGRRRRVATFGAFFDFGAALAVRRAPRACVLDVDVAGAADAVAADAGAGTPIVGGASAATSPARSIAGSC
jgi:hypothetical protein